MLRRRRLTAPIMTRGIEIHQVIRYSHELQRGHTPAAVAFQVTAWVGVGHTPRARPTRAATTVGTR